MSIDRSDYFSYLLRLWLSGVEGSREWRASLEEVDSGDIHGFSCLEELYDYLKTQTNIASDLGLDPTER